MTLNPVQDPDAFCLSHCLSVCLSVCVQHFAILLKYVIHVAIPDIPNWVGEEMAKLEYQRREAFKVNTPTRVSNPAG